jgi:hypothetical protein
MQNFWGYTLLIKVVGIFSIGNCKSIHTYKYNSQPVYVCLTIQLLFWNNASYEKTVTTKKCFLSEIIQGKIVILPRHA